MQNTALIVHDIMDSPDRWSIEGKELTNGYYKIALNAGSYSAGAATYHATPAESESLSKAVAHWKRATKYAEPGQEPVKRVGDLPPPVQPVVISSSEVAGRMFALSEFYDTVKKAHSGYKIHMDPAVLSNSVDKAVSDYESKFSVQHEQRSDGHSKKAGV